MSIGSFGILILIAFSIAWCVIFVIRRPNLSRNKSSSSTTIIQETAPPTTSQPEAANTTSSSSLPTISGPLPYRNPNDDCEKNERKEELFKFLIKSIFITFVII